VCFGGSRFGVSSMDVRRKARLLPELSNFYCHPGRAGGLPGLLGCLLPSGASAPPRVLFTNCPRALPRRWLDLSFRDISSGDLPCPGPECPSRPGTTLFVGSAFHRAEGQCPLGVALRMPSVWERVSHPTPFWIGRPLSSWPTLAGANAVLRFLKTAPARSMS
jgi:hypothetical protein